MSERNFSEEHYAIDSIDMSGDNWEYLTEDCIQDTRLIKMYSQEGDYLVLRPPSLGERKRLSSVGNDPIEKADTFRDLLMELEYFGIKTPELSMFVSETHTKEGSRGGGLCVASQYIHGKILPLDLNGQWKDKQLLFYNRMDEWLNKITTYSIAKYLSSEKDTLFLTDIFRPIQFVYSFEDKNIYLVDLDPLFERIKDEEDNISPRFLVGLSTINNYRNKYLNKMYRDGINMRSFGEECKSNLLKLMSTEAFTDDASTTPYNSRILKNLKQALVYRSEE